MSYKNNNYIDLPKLKHPQNIVWYAFFNYILGLGLGSRQKKTMKAGSVEERFESTCTHKQTKVYKYSTPMDLKALSNGQ